MKKERTSSERSTKNKEVYSTWRDCIDPAARERFAKAKRPRKTLVKAGVFAIGIALLLTIFAHLVAMSQFSTLGYEIEKLQDRKAQLIEENSDLRSAIASYTTTTYYRKKAIKFGMKKGEKITYLKVAGSDVAEDSTQWQDETSR